MLLKKKFHIESNAFWDKGLLWNDCCFVLISSIACRNNLGDASKISTHSLQQKYIVSPSYVAENFSTDNSVGSIGHLVLLSLAPDEIEIENKNRIKK